MKFKKRQDLWIFKNFKMPAQRDTGAKGTLREDCGGCKVELRGVGEEWRFYTQ